MKFKKLNPSGFSHDLVIVFVVVIFAIGGVAYIVSSKADSCSAVAVSSPVSTAVSTVVSGTVSDPACGTVSSPVTAPVPVSSTPGPVQQPVDRTPPSAPTNLGGAAQKGGYIALHWTASKDNVAVKGYKVYLNGWGQVASVPGTRSILHGAKKGTKYTYTVKAFDSTGNLSASSASFTIKGK